MKVGILAKAGKLTSLFKIFHRATCTNQFLHTIGKTNSALLFFSKNLLNLTFMFCDCDKICSLWDAVIWTFLLSDKNVGKIWIYVPFIKCLTWNVNFLTLYLQFYIHRCRFLQCTTFIPISAQGALINHFNERIFLLHHFVDQPQNGWFLSFSDLFPVFEHIAYVILGTVHKYLLWEGLMQ